MYDCKIKKYIPVHDAKAGFSHFFFAEKIMLLLLCIAVSQRKYRQFIFAFPWDVCVISLLQTYYIGQIFFEVAYSLLIGTLTVIISKNMYVKLWEGKEKSAIQFWIFAYPPIELNRSPRWQDQKYMWSICSYIATLHYWCPFYRQEGETQRN